MRFYARFIGVPRYTFCKDCDQSKCFCMSPDCFWTPQQVSSCMPACVPDMRAGGLPVCQTKKDACTL